MSVFMIAGDGLVGYNHFCDEALSIVYNSLRGFKTNLKTHLFRQDYS